MAGTGVAVSFAPETANAAVVVRVPLTAVTVTTRLDLSAPVEIVAAKVPAASVFSPVTEKTALLSTEKLTGTAATTCPPSEVVVAVAVTVEAPVLDMLVVLKAKTSFVAANAPGAAPPPGTAGFTNPGVPDEPPPPPQAAKVNNKNNEAKLFSMFISESIRVSKTIFQNQRAAERSVTTLGVRKIKSSVLLSVRDLVLNKLPK